MICRNRVKEALQTSGVGFGYFDLAQAMGLEGQTHHPDVDKKIEEAMKLAQKNKVEIQVHLFESSPLRPVHAGANQGRLLQ